jgi:hypothetical protein
MNFYQVEMSLTDIMTSETSLRSKNESIEFAHNYYGRVEERDAHHYWLIAFACG